MESTAIDDYWQRVVPIAKLPLPPADYEHDVYFLWHQTREQYGRGHREIGIQLTAAGERDYVHAKAYYSLPRIVLTIGLTPPVKIDLGEEIGQVLDSETQGITRHEVAGCQAWYYGQQKTLMLWEVDIRSHYRSSDDPSQDFLLITLWDSFEKVLLKEFAGCKQIIAPGWEPSYEADKWRKSLSERGFTAHRENTYIKILTQ